MSEGKLSLSAKPFDFNRMIRTSAWTMESMWQEKKVNMAVELDPAAFDLPLVMGDETRLHQVLANYLSNAVKFTPTGGFITLRTKVEERSKDSLTITVSVTDTGIGISEENQTKLFHPFVQIDPGKNQGGKGTGLGLSICASIIENMKGVYGVRSTPGQGSTFFFTVTLPLSSTPVNQIEDVVSAKDKNKSPEVIEQVGFSLDVLVTDDDPLQRKIMKQLVTKLGHTVDTAVDGIDCIEKVARSIAISKPFDVIFIDNQMPRLDGGRTIVALRAANVRTPIISLTATTDRDFHQQLREWGATQILVKPSSRAIIDKSLKMLPFPDKLPVSRSE
jgi:CheY-like chemotaxis protein